MTTRFCTGCGAQRVDGAAFCPSCGAPAEAARPEVPLATSLTPDPPPLAAMPPMWTPEPGHAPSGPAAVPESPDPDWGAERAAFVGPNADYYINKWNEIAARGTRISWNWAAFLLSLFWLIYRKMFIAAGVVAAGLLLITLLGVLAPSLAPLAGILTIVPAVLVGLFGNRLYRDHVERSINELERSVRDPASRQSTLQARGGVAMPLALGAAAAWVTAFVGLYFLALRGTQPAYPEFGTGDQAYGAESSAPRSITGDPSPASVAPGAGATPSTAAPRPMTMPSNALWFFGTWGSNCPASTAESITLFSDGTLQAAGRSGRWTIDSGSTITMTGIGPPVSLRWVFSSHDAALVYGVGSGRPESVRRCR